MYPEHWKPNDNIDTIQKFWRERTFNHSDKGRYTGAYFDHVEDIKAFMDQHGFECIDLIGSTNIGAALNQQ